MNRLDKPIVWLHGKIQTPPFSKNARIEAGFLLRLLQKGEKISLPQSRPMMIIDKKCHELRMDDENLTQRIVYRIDRDAIIIAEVFEKKSQKTPKNVIDVCKKRLKEYDSL